LCIINQIHQHLINNSSSIKSSDSFTSVDTFNLIPLIYAAY
jgi:hypothetical protein